MGTLVVVGSGLGLWSRGPILCARVGLRTERVDARCPWGRWDAVGEGHLPALPRRQTPLEASGAQGALPGECSGRGAESRVLVLTLPLGGGRCWERLLFTHTDTHTADPYKHTCTHGEPC